MLLILTIKVEPSVDWRFAKNFFSMIKATICLSLVFLSTIVSASGQDILSGKALAIQYDNMEIGRNVNITYRHTFERNWTIYGGIKYFINNRKYVGDVSFEEYGKFRQFRTEGAWHFGPKIGVEKAFSLRQNVDLFGFFDMQYTRPFSKHAIVIVEGGSPTMGNQVGDQVTTRWVLENYLGTGTRIAVTDKINLRLQAGAGVLRYAHRGGRVTYKRIDNFYDTGLRGDVDDLELSYMVGIGVEYSLR